MICNRFSIVRILRRPYAENLDSLRDLAWSLNLPFGNCDSETNSATLDCRRKELLVSVAGRTTSK